MSHENTALSSSYEPPMSQNLGFDIRYGADNPGYSVLMGKAQRIIGIILRRLARALNNVPNGFWVAVWGARVGGTHLETWKSPGLGHALFDIK